MLQECHQLCGLVLVGVGQVDVLRNRGRGGGMCCRKATTCAVWFLSGRGRLMSCAGGRCRGVLARRHCIVKGAQRKQTHMAVLLQ